MRAVVQRASEGRVTVQDRDVGIIGRGFVILLGVGAGDTGGDAVYLAEKIANLRVFDDGRGRMNLSLLDVDGEALVVSQFTLYGDCRKGRRPSFTSSAPPDRAERLYLDFVAALQGMGVAVATGVFGAMMTVTIINDGPVTLLLDSDRSF